MIFFFFFLVQQLGGPDDFNTQVARKYLRVQSFWSVLTWVGFFSIKGVLLHEKIFLQNYYY